MPGEKHLVVVGTPHHITQRGNNRQAVFRSDADRHFYLKTLKAKCEQHNLRVLGYCFMTNHVHLVATPEHESSMARALGQTHMIYAQRFNFTARRSGHVWQNRFYSCPLGPTRLLDALVYVDTNPVRARIVDQAVHYRWSSAAAHISHIDPAKVLDKWTWADLDHERGRSKLRPYEQLSCYQCRRVATCCLASGAARDLEDQRLCRRCL